MHYFFVKNNNKNIIFTDLDAHHIVKVLRKKVNDILHCVDQNNFLIEVKITSLKPISVEIIKMEEIKQLNISKINVYLGIIKKQNFELLIRFLNEMNVNSLTPVLFERSQNNIIYDKKRIQHIILESCKQSKRIAPMLVKDSLKYNDFLNEIKTKKNYFANEKEKINSFSQLNCKIKENVNLIIGPEGGFTIDEIREISEISLGISLGPNILKSETAAIYMSSIFLDREIINEK